MRIELTNTFRQSVRLDNPGTVVPLSSITIRSYKVMENRFDRVPNHLFR